MGNYKRSDREKIISMDEFSLIEKFFVKNHQTTDIVLGIGDDAALIKTTNTKHLAISVDTLIENVHFDNRYRPEDIGYRALAVNLSDMAAMGAEARFFTLALTISDVDIQWLKLFSQGLFALADKHNIALIGGDSTKGKAISITIQVMGEVDLHQQMLRSAAQIGDGVYVSNNLGDAALALKGEKRLNQYLYRPEPQLALGKALRDIANACIDLSDGLIGDLAHILKQSQVGAEVDYHLLPLSPLVKQYVKDSQDYCLPLAGGDDYQLCFTVSPIKEKELASIAKKLDVTLTKIGVINDKKNLKIKNLKKKCQAYRHFI